LIAVSLKIKYDLIYFSMFVVDDKWQVDKDLSQSRPLLMPCQVLLLQRIFGVMPSKLGNNNP
jgi:hypothetical protein